MADIPGLIDGAAEGVGLGHDFLRHIERTKILVHVLDVSGMEGRDPIEDYEKINSELVKYSPKLAKKYQVIAANKIDLLEDDTNMKRLMEYMNDHGRDVYPICAMSGEGLPELMEHLWQLLEEYVEEPEAKAGEEVVYKAEEKPEFTVTRDDDGAFVLTGPRIERLVAMTNFDDDMSLRRFQRIWRYMELDTLLRKNGIQEGDTVRIYTMEFEYHQ